jgi:hypothetical protein
VSGENTSTNRTTIIIERELWIEFKITAIRQGKTASKLLRELITEEIKKGGEGKDGTFPHDAITGNMSIK